MMQITTIQEQTAAVFDSRVNQAITNYINQGLIVSLETWVTPQYAAGGGDSMYIQTAPVMLTAIVIGKPRTNVI